VKDRFGDIGNDSNKLAQAEGAMMTCAGVCIDKHIALLPGLKKKLIGRIDDMAGQKSR
jgi:hypothetical protein